MMMPRAASRARGFASAMLSHAMVHGYIESAERKQAVREFWHLLPEGILCSARSGNWKSLVKQMLSMVLTLHWKLESMLHGSAKP